MEECPACGSPLMVADCRFKSEVGSEDVYAELKLVCINPKCGNYCGPDLNSPRTVVGVKRNKVN